MARKSAGRSVAMIGSSSIKPTGAEDLEHGFASAGRILPHEHRDMTRNADIPAIPEFITHKEY
jgi:hypothetical protein